MNPNPKPLTSLQPGDKGVIKKLRGGRAFKARMTGMGLNENNVVELVQGNENSPVVVGIGSSRVVIGHGMAEKVMVTKIDEEQRSNK